jgi:GAF domain-containing protein
MPGASADWPKLKALYISCTTPAKAFAEQNQISFGALRRQICVNKWDDDRNAISHEITESAIDKRKADMGEELAQFNADDLMVARALRAQVAASISKAQQLKTPLKASDLRALAGTAEVAQRMGRLVLGASTENQAHQGTQGSPIEHLVITHQQFVQAAQKLISET